MPHNQRLRKLPLQAAEQGKQRRFLLRRAGVGRAVEGIQSAFVADAHGVPVVVQAVGAHPFQRPAVVDGAVTGQVEVVADVAETPVADVVAAAIVKAQASPRRGRRAMDDKQCDLAHEATCTN